MHPDYPAILDPAYPLVALAVVCAMTVWLLLLAWALGTGHFSVSGEAVKQRVFEEGGDHDPRP